MISKSSIRIASLVIFMAIALPASSSIIVPDFAKTIVPSGSEIPRAQQLVQRLEEIRDMDKSELTSMEKKNLRKELREIRREVRSSHNGVYLSVGAVIIIILLLILLL